MSSFAVDIMTPERLFFTGQVEALTVTLSDGEMTLLAGHERVTAALAVGELKYKIDGQWHICASSEGFLEVMEQRVAVFVQSCEHPEEIDAARARAALERANHRLHSKQSLRDHELTRVSLSRAMARLRVTGGPDRINDK